MEKYIIRVNGNEYEVEVEKKDCAGGAPGFAQPQSETKAAAPQPNSGHVQGAAPQPNSGQAEGGQAASGQEVTAGTAGKVWKVTAEEGAEVKRGDSIIVLEAMKMEIPVVAPCDGRVGKLLVSEGDSVDMGQAIAIVA